MADVYIQGCYLPSFFYICCSFLPLHASRCHLAMVIDWAPTFAFIPCQVQPGAAHSLDAYLSGQKEHEVGILMDKVYGKAI